jgi:hypothetical protein
VRLFGVAFSLPLVYHASFYNTEGGGAGVVDGVAPPPSSPRQPVDKLKALDASKEGWVLAKQIKQDRYVTLTSSTLAPKLTPDLTRKEEEWFLATS